jgi:hypothetical protein
LDPKPRYLRLYVSSLRSAYYSRPGTRDLFHHLLLLAKREERAPGKERKVIWDGQEIVLERGEFTFTYRGLARDLKMSASTIHDNLKMLAEMKMLNAKPGKGRTRFSIVKICNWETYQPEWESSEQSTERQPNASRTLAEHPRIIGERDNRKRRGPKLPLGPNLERLERLYKGCQYWRESAAKQALRWAGPKGEDFLGYVSQLRAKSKPEYMPGPTSAYRRWKEDNRATAESQTKIPTLTTVAIVKETGVEKVHIPTADLQNRLATLRKEHGEHAVRVVA